MRRLPIYFLLDVSDSMVGEPREALQKGLERIVDELRSNPYALETAHISVIAFAGRAKTLVPLTDVLSYYNPSLSVGSGTALGLAMEQLMESIDKDVKMSVEGKKGDWQPLVYILTDGKPTDSYDAAFARWKEDYAHRTHVVAIGLGQFADTEALSQIAEQTFTYSGENKKDFNAMIRWISNSISAVSASPGDVDLNKAISLEKDGLTLAPAGSTTRHDQDCVVLKMRCRQSGKLYLAKFEREVPPGREVLGFDLDLQGEERYLFTGCHIVDESYFEWSDVAEQEQVQVSTNKLVGGLPCPHCGSQAGAACQCGNLFCAPEPGEHVICPWCQASGLASNSGSGPSSVGRSSG